MWNAINTVTSARMTYSRHAMDNFCLLCTPLVWCTNNCVGSHSLVPHVTSLLYPFLFLSPFTFPKLASLLVFCSSSPSFVTGNEPIGAWRIGTSPAHEPTSANSVERLGLHRLDQAPLRPFWFSDELPTVAYVVGHVR